MQDIVTFLYDVNIIYTALAVKKIKIKDVGERLPLLLSCWTTLFDKLKDLVKGF